MLWAKITATLRYLQLESKAFRKKEFIVNENSGEAYRVTADELRQFIERFENLEIEKRNIADQQKEVMAEAKGRGYDTKILRKLVVLRKRDLQDIAEEEAVLDMYKSALGMK